MVKIEPFDRLKKIINPKQLKITPEIFQIILLDEIAERLEDIAELLKREQVNGDIESFVYNVTDSGVEIRVLSYKWVSMTILNDGTNDLYVSNKLYSQTAPLKQNESLRIRLTKKAIDKIWLWTDPGLTTIARVFALR
ncbi:MAG: hypothetical protein LWW95_08325 [Candidatus Desulfofervidus auxilii]|nr:hypothetical protein [Candidatus Desulfofervidus auxilii]